MKKDTVRISVSCSADLHGKIEAVARAAHRSVSGQVAFWLEQKMAGVEKAKGIQSTETSAATGPEITPEGVEQLREQYKSMSLFEIERARRELVVENTLLMQKLSAPGVKRSSPERYETASLLRLVQLKISLLKDAAAAKVEDDLIENNGWDEELG